MQCSSGSSGRSGIQPLVYCSFFINNITISIQMKEMSPLITGLICVPWSRRKDHYADAVLIVISVAPNSLTQHPHCDPGYEHPCCFMALTHQPVIVSWCPLTNRRCTCRPRGERPRQHQNKSRVSTRPISLQGRRFGVPAARNVPLRRCKGRDTNNPTSRRSFKCQICARTK